MPDNYDAEIAAALGQPPASGDNYDAEIASALGQGDAYDAEISQALGKPDGKSILRSIGDLIGVKPDATPIQAAMQTLSTPFRGWGAIGVTGTSGLQKGAEAAKVGYEPKSMAEKVGSFIGRAVPETVFLKGPLGLTAKAAKYAGLGKVITSAIEGAVAGAAISPVTEIDETGDTSLGTVATGGIVGGVLGGAVGKISSKIDENKAAKLAKTKIAKETFDKEARQKNAEFIRKQAERDIDKTYSQIETERKVLSSQFDSKNAELAKVNSQFQTKDQYRKQLLEESDRLYKEYYSVPAGQRNPRIAEKANNLKWEALTLEGRINRNFGPLNRNGLFGETTDIVPKSGRQALQKQKDLLEYEVRELRGKLDDFDKTVSERLRPARERLEWIRAGRPGKKPTTLGGMAAGPVQAESKFAIEAEKNARSILTSSDPLEAAARTDANIAADAISKKLPSPSVQPDVLKIGDAEMPNPVKAAWKMTDGTRKIIDDIKGSLNIGDEEIIKVLQQPYTKISDDIVSIMRKYPEKAKDIAEYFGHKVTPGDNLESVIQGFRSNIKASATNLGLLSDLERYRNSVVSEPVEFAGLGKEIGELLNKNADSYALEKALYFGHGLSSDIINAWRASLTAMLGTGVRNVAASGARYGIGMIDDLVNGSLQYVTGKSNFNNSFTNITQDALTLGRLFSRGYSKKLMQLIDAEPAVKSALGRNPLSDLKNTAYTNVGKKLNTYSRAINIFNLMGERIVRRIGFDSRFRASLDKLGIGIDDFAKLPAEQKQMIMMDAVDNALELSFAKTPTNQYAKGILKAYESFPLLYVLGNPFPRFWMNALKFVTEFSPLGLMYKRASSNPEMQLRWLSRSITGSALWAAALAFRGSKYSGERWYEIYPKAISDSFSDKIAKTIPGLNRLGDNDSIDMRNYAPFSASAFMADAFIRYLEVKSIDPKIEQQKQNARDAWNSSMGKMPGIKKLKPRRVDMGYGMEEFANAILALRRSDFSGIPLLDNTIFNKEDMITGIPKFQKSLEKMFGDFIGGFATPVKQFRDISAGFESEPVFSTQQSPLLGPSVQALSTNLARKTMTEEPTPFKNESRMRDMPALRQFPGISVTRKTPGERLLHSLDFKEADFRAKTGDPDLDDEATKYIGMLVGPVFNEMAKYSNGATMEGNKYIASILLTELKEIGTDIAKNIKQDISQPLELKRISNELPISVKLTMKREADKILKARYKGRLP